MRSEREPSRYEPLNETHRRVAEEEKLRQAEQEARGRRPEEEPQPTRPGPDPARNPTRPEPETELDSPEARLAARKEELEELVARGRINQSEMVYRLRQYDNELRVELETGRTVRSDQAGDRRGEASAEAVHDQSEPSQHRADDRAGDADRGDADRPVPGKRIEREAEAAEYEITGRGEMTDARAARLARLRNIDHAIEREHQEKEGSESGHDHDGGERSR